MTPREFVLKCYKFAKDTEAKTGLSAIATLAQAALESGWGSAAIGNMYFGQKDSDGLNGNEQLITTWEDLDNPNAKFPVTISVVQIGKKLWRYKVKDWFRKYNTPEECFTEHARFFPDRPRFAQAWTFRTNPDLFFDAIEKAGYATSKDPVTGLPNYASTLKKVAVTIKRIIYNEGL